MSEKVTIKEKVSYALANLGNIPIQTVLSSYLLIFYTNVVGLDPAACATLFLIARILDGLNDPIVGYIIDHVPTKKMGHFRPTLILGTVLCSLNFLLLWFGPLMANGGKLVIAYISYLLIGIMFPIMDISLNSLLPVMTSDADERNALSSLKGFVYMLGMFGVNMVAPLIIGDTTKAGGYKTLIILVTCVVFVFSIVGALGVKERVKASPSQEKYKVADLFRILIKRPVLMTFLSNLFYNISIFAMNAALAYFFTYVLGNLALLSVVSIVQLVALLPATIIVGKLIGRYGKKNTYVLGLCIIGLFPLIRLIDVTNIPILMIATAVTGFASGLCMPLSYGIQADNTDYIELDMGQRAEGAISSLSSFITKCAMGLGGAIPGYLLAAVHFDAAAETQPASVRTVIILCAIVIPAIGSVIGALFMKFGYPLDKDTLAEQNRRIAEIRAKQDTEA